MKIVETKINLDALILAKGRAKKKYYLFSDKEFNDKVRVLMSEETRTMMEYKLTCCVDHPWPKFSYLILGMKILIDDSIPFGECEIFINAEE